VYKVKQNIRNLKEYQLLFNIELSRMCYKEIVFISNCTLATYLFCIILVDQLSLKIRCIMPLNILFLALAF